MLFVVYVKLVLKGFELTFPVLAAVAMLSCSWGSQVGLFFDGTGLVLHKF